MNSLNPVRDRNIIIDNFKTQCNQNVFREQCLSNFASQMLSLAYGKHNYRISAFQNSPVRRFICSLNVKMCQVSDSCSYTVHLCRPQCMRLLQVDTGRLNGKRKSTFRHGR